MSHILKEEVGDGSTKETRESAAGGTIAVPGLWTIPARAPRPENVTPASGAFDQAVHNYIR
jgi:hypothetical protein